MTTKYQPGVRVSEYVLEECVGAGTFGEVWRARHHVWDNERVAVKLPTEPEYMRYLQREGVVVHGLRHPNIIRMLGMDPYADTPYLVMELVNGPSLRDMLKEHPKGIDVKVAVVILRGILSGVAAAHAGSVIHRDLKPGNVMLNLDDRPLAEVAAEDVKIGDFGLGIGNADTLRSMIMQSASIERDQESTAIAGTLAYMAPELRDGIQEPSPRADLYSIGVVLYEMLTGERPAGAELPSTLRADVPTALDEVFRRMYAHYDHRYESAEAVLADLDARLAPPRPPQPVTTSAGEASHPAHQYTRCPSCRHEVESDDQYCTQCGRQMVDRIPRCPSCGGYPGPHDRFCIFCGAAVPSPEE
ncbi:MAG: protein kinase [Phycisphaerae bacterium]|nr:protein kinase [Phycisphaerae bacterium]